MIDLKQGDCLERMREIPDGSVDLILTDPPYGLTSCSWDEAVPAADLWPEWERVCKPSGIIVVFGTEPFSTTMRASNKKRYKYDWIWKKPFGAGFVRAKTQPLRDYENVMVFYSSDIINDTTNHFAKSKDYLVGEKEKAEAAGYSMNKVLGNCMASHYFTRKTQFAFPKREDYEKLQTTGFFKREYDEAKREYDEAKREYDEAKRVTYNPQMTKGQPYVIKQRAGYTQYGGVVNPYTDNETGDRYPKQVLEFNYDKDRGYHPTQKPTDLLAYLIRTYTNPGETVFDPFAGSGSTGVACVREGRNFLGIEKDPEYFRIMQERIRKAEKEQKLAHTE